MGEARIRKDKWAEGVPAVFVSGLGPRLLGFRQVPATDQHGSTIDGIESLLTVQSFILHE